jgi:antitoxin component YwqK of YwqJK toxin-antitoxin module
MKFRPPLLAAALTSAAVFSQACDNRNKPAHHEDGTEVVPPGAQTSGPEVIFAEFEDIGWEDELYTKDGKPFTGVMSKHEDGKLMGRYHITDGKLNGMVEEWWPNGVRNTLKTFRDGKQDGVSTYWDEAGEPTKVISYNNGEELEVITDPEKLAKIPK